MVYSGGTLDRRRSNILGDSRFPDSKSGKRSSLIHNAFGIGVAGGNISWKLLPEKQTEPVTKNEPNSPSVIKVAVKVMRGVEEEKSPYAIHDFPPACYGLSSSHYLRH